MRIAYNLLSRSERPTAILTGPSSFANGILKVAQDLDICVPDELALACLSDSELTRSSHPPITSLDLCMEEVGAEAVRLAIALSKGDVPPSTPTLITPNINWRKSLPQPIKLKRDIPQAYSITK